LNLNLITSKNKCLILQYNDLLISVKEVEVQRDVIEEWLLPALDKSHPCMLIAVSSLLSFVLAFELQFDTISPKVCDEGVL
jgi:hypothetical protein